MAAERNRHTFINQIPMKKKHMIALAIALVVVVFFIPLGYFGIDMNAPFYCLIGMVGSTVGTVAAVMIGSTDPSDSADAHH